MSFSPNPVNLIADLTLMNGAWTSARLIGLTVLMDDMCFIHIFCFFFRGRKELFSIIFRWSLFCHSV